MRKRYNQAMQSTAQQSTAQQPTANRQIARAAGTIMATFIVVKLVGLLASMLMARAFGTSDQQAAFVAANQVSDTLFSLVAGGALASAFIPTFTTLLTRDRREDAWRLASAVCNLVLLVLIVLSLLCAIFAPWVVTNLLTQFNNPEQVNLTVNLLRIQIASAVIFGLSGLVMGVLNAHQRFLAPALAPAMYPLGIIFGVEILAKRMGMGIYGAAWGVVAGALLHLLIQLPQLVRLPRLRFTPSLGLHLPAVRDVLILMGPRLVGVAVVQINFWINNFLASARPADLPALKWAFALMIMPEAAIAQSIAIAALPTFSAQVASGRPEEMRHSLATTLRGALLLAIPASIGLILLRRPLVGLIYGGGEFSEQSTELVAWALLWFAAGLVGHCVVEIVSRAFYALHDTRTPVMIGIAAMSLNVIFSLAFYQWFAQMGLPPHGGLALANTLATALETGGLLFLMRQRLDGLHGGEILRAVGASLMSTLAMATGLWLWMQFGTGLRNGLLVAVGIGLGGLIYGGMLAALRVPEISFGWNWITAKMRANS
jgi:putative peptidoglycan lipid II flippase